MTAMEELTMQAIQTMNYKVPEVTLRDLFAMHALTSFGGGSWNGSYLNILEENKYNHIETAAKVAYKLADAMIKAREEK